MEVDSLITGGLSRIRKAPRAPRASSGGRFINYRGSLQGS